MKRIIFTLICMFSCALQAQKDDYVFIIEGYDTVGKREFINSFLKNNENTSYTAEELRDYLGLYVNYRLKLLDAKSKGFDKNPDIIAQIENYRNTIIDKIINDPVILDSLARQAYERQKLLLHVSHCLVAVPRNSTFADTVLYYQKARDIYNRAVKGENFTDLIKRYSDDSSPYTKDDDYAGDLGYFSSMAMIYPFENACYELATGSDRIGFVRTDYGYHIIKLENILPVDYSDVSLKHIFISPSLHTDKEAEELINKAYNDIFVLGFDTVARMYSDDKNSASRGGFISNQLPNMLPAQYIDVFTQIGKDSVSRPFKTRFGWHIVQFTGVVPLRKYEQQKEEIIDRISRDSRGYYAVDMLINRVKQDYKYRVDSVAVDELYSVMSDSVFESAWQLPSDAERFGRRIMFIGDTSFAQKDLLDFIYEHQMKQLPMDMTVFLYMMTDNFGKIKILEYIREHFEDRYPELKNNIKDYYEGELIFAITDRNVWTASVIDSLGLAEFYNKNKSNYMYTRRADAVIWTIDSASDNIAKISKIIDKRKRKGKTNDEVKEILLKKGYHVNYYWNCFERGSNIIIDRNIFDKGLAKNTGKFPVCITDNQPVSGKRSVLYVNNILEPSVKPLDVCRGLCISDYQAYLEKNWMQQLHDKYKVRINYEALDSLIKK